MARIIVVTSGKGGVGKSTITYLLGKSLAKQKKKVALIDADLGLKNLDTIMGLEARVVYDVEDVKKGHCSLNQALIKDKEYPDLYLLPACLKTSADALYKVDMHLIIQEMNSQFDFIILDSPAGIEKGFYHAIKEAQEVLLVVTLDKTSLRDADKVIGILHSEHLDDIKIIINKYPKKNNEKNPFIPISEVERILGKKVISILYEEDNIRKSQNENVILSDQIMHHYDDLAMKITGEKMEKNLSLWQRIMNKVHLS